MSSNQEQPYYKNDTQIIIIIHATACLPKRKRDSTKKKYTNFNSIRIGNVDTKQVAVDLVLVLLLLLLLLLVSDIVTVYFVFFLLCFVYFVLYIRCPPIASPATYIFRLLFRCLSSIKKPVEIVASRALNSLLRLFSSYSVHIVYQFCKDFKRKNRFISFVSSCSFLCSMLFLPLIRFWDLILFFDFFRNVFLIVVYDDKFMQEKVCKTEGANRTIMLRILSTANMISRWKTLVECQPKSVPLLHETANENDDETDYLVF